LLRNHKGLNARVLGPTLQLIEPVAISTLCSLLTLSSNATDE
jgi:hypothetical protein